MYLTARGLCDQVLWTWVSITIRGGIVGKLVDLLQIVPSRLALALYSELAEPSLPHPSESRETLMAKQAARL